MSEPETRPPPSLTSRVATAAVLALLVGIGLRPYLPSLGYWPLTVDGVWWFTEFVVPRSDWAKIVFADQHGTGYRPVAALSYLLNHAVAGSSPLVYRATDLGLHALGGVLVYALFRRLAPALAAWGGLVAAGLFLTHPAAAAVVPLLETRSYSLATVLVLGACLALPRDAGAAPGRLLLRSLPAALLLSAALLANEAAAVAVGALPLVALALRPWQWRRAAWIGAAPIAAALLTLLVRASRVEGLGGYGSRRLEAEWALPVFQAFFRTLVDLPLPHPFRPTEIHPALAAGLLLAGGVLAWRALWVPARRRGPAADAALPVFAAWLLGYAALYTALGVWFARLAYPALVPFALLCGSVLAATVRDHRQQPLRLAALLAPQLLLVGHLLLHSPSWEADLPRGDQRAATQHLIEDLRQQLEQVEPPALVRLAMPYRREPSWKLLRGHPTQMTPGLPRNHAAPSYLIEALMAGRDIVVEDFLFFETLNLREPRNIRFARVEGRPALMVPAKQVFFVIRPPNAIRMESRGESQVWLDDPPLPEGRHPYVYIASGERGVLTPIERR